MLWKILRHRENRVTLAGVVEGENAAAASAAELARFDVWRSDYARTTIEPIGEVARASLRVRVTPEFALDGGSVVSFAHAGHSWRAVVPPAVPMMDQAIAYVEGVSRENPNLPSRRLTIVQQGTAVARLAFRWGSYIALIADSTKPRSRAAGTKCGYWNDSEQARMSIEISANLDRLQKIMVHQPSRWQRIVLGASQLPGPVATRDAAFPRLLMRRLSGGAMAGYRDLEREMRRGAGGKRLGDDVLRALIDAEDKPEIWRSFDENPTRRITNTFTHTTWRVALEDLHGTHPGAPELADDVVYTLGHDRFTDEEHSRLDKVMSLAGTGFVRMMAAVSALQPDEVRRRAAFPTTSGEAAEKWSITENTRIALL